MPMFLLEDDGSSQPLILGCSQSNTLVTWDSPSGQSVDLQVLPPPLDKMKLKCDVHWFTLHTGVQRNLSWQCSWSNCYLNSKGEGAAECSQPYRAEGGAWSPSGDGLVIAVLYFLSLWEWSAKSRVIQSPREYTSLSNRSSQSSSLNSFTFPSSEGQK